MEERAGAFSSRMLTWVSGSKKNTGWSSQVTPDMLNRRPRWGAALLFFWKRKHHDRFIRLKGPLPHKFARLSERLRSLKESSPVLPLSSSATLVQTRPWVLAESRGTQVLGTLHAILLSSGSLQTPHRLQAMQQARNHAASTQEQEGPRVPNHQRTDRVHRTWNPAFSSYFFRGDRGRLSKG